MSVYRTAPESHDDLIARLRERSKDPRRLRDMVFTGDCVAPPTTVAEIAEAEQRLGIELPSLLASLYTAIGNGGFGPGYGLLGLIHGHSVGDDRAVSLWEAWTSCHLDARYQAWRYPRTFLPLAAWGCAIYSCVDLADPSSLVWRFEPSGFIELGSGEDDDPDLVPTTQEEFSELFGREAPLAEWLESWLAGTLEQ